MYITVLFADTAVSRYERKMLGFSFVCVRLVVYVAVYECVFMCLRWCLSVESWVSILYWVVGFAWVFLCLCACSFLGVYATIWVCLHVSFTLCHLWKLSFHPVLGCWVCWGFPVCLCVFVFVSVRKSIWVCLHVSVFVCQCWKLSFHPVLRCFVSVSLRHNIRPKNLFACVYLSVYFCKNNNLLCVYLLKANQLSVKKKVGIHFWFITLKSANVFCFGLLAAKSLLKTMRSFLRGLIILKNEINEKLNSRLELDLSSFLKLYSLIL